MSTDILADILGLIGIFIIGACAGYSFATTYPPRENTASWEQMLRRQWYRRALAEAEKHFKAEHPGA